MSSPLSNHPFQPDRLHQAFRLADSGQLDRSAIQPLRVKIDGSRGAGTYYFMRNATQKQ
jgi:hypothetical protein